MYLCLKCQNDNADHTTEYCPTHTCKNCGGSGHVSKVCPKKGTTPNQTSNQSVRKNPAVLHRSLKGDDEDELFNQALSTVNKVDTRTLELLQKAVSNSSARVPRQIVSSSVVYTPPEFEPVKKKSRNFDHEDTVLQNGKNNDYLDYLDHNRASTSQFASNFARICPPGTSVSAGPASKIGGKFESSSIPLNIKPRPAASSNSDNYQGKFAENVRGKNDDSQIPSLPMPRCEPSTSKSYEEMSTGYRKTSKSYQNRQSRTPDYRNAIDSKRSLPESPPPSEKRKFRPGSRNYRKNSESELSLNCDVRSPEYSPVTKSIENCPSSPEYIPVTENLEDIEKSPEYIPVTKSRSPSPIRGPKIVYKRSRSRSLSRPLSRSTRDRSRTRDHSRTRDTSRSRNQEDPSRTRERSRTRDRSRTRKKSRKSRRSRTRSASRPRSKKSKRSRSSSRSRSGPRSKVWDSPLIRRKSVPSPVSFHPKNRKRSSKTRSRTRSRSRSRSQSPVSRRPHRRIRGPPMDDSPILRRNNVPSPPSHKPKLPPMIRQTNVEPEPEINPRLAKMQKSAKYKNPVSLLNEWYPPPDNPVYECTPSNTGHPNRTIYEMKCTLEGYEYFAKARTKKDAGVYVAFKVLDDLDCAEYCGGYEGEGHGDEKRVINMIEEPEVVSLHDTTGNSSVVEIDNESDSEVGVASKKNTSK